MRMPSKVLRAPKSTPNKHIRLIWFSLLAALIALLSCTHTPRRFPDSRLVDRSKQVKPGTRYNFDRILVTDVASSREKGRLSFNVVLKNISQQELALMCVIRYYDGEGYEIRMGPLNKVAISLRPGETCTVSGKAPLDEVVNLSLEFLPQSR
jgi:uncharacterized protein YcfL